MAEVGGDSRGMGGSSGVAVGDVRRGGDRPQMKFCCTQGLQNRNKGSAEVHNGNVGREKRNLNLLKSFRR